MPRLHGQRNRFRNDSRFKQPGRWAGLALPYDTLRAIEHAVDPQPRPKRDFDQCPRCLRTGLRRRMFPDGTCVSRNACDKERAAAIADGLITEEEEMPNKGLLEKVRKIPLTELAQMDVHELMEKTGVAYTEAFRARKAATAEINSVGASDSLKAQVLTIIKTHGTQPDLLSIQEHLDGRPPMIDISKAVWSLQKQGELTFYERKHGKDSVVTQIKLPKGHRAIHHKVGGGKAGPVGRDMTEARYQPAVAPGGPVEHIPPRPEPIKQDIVPTPVYQAPPTPVVAPAPRYAAAEPPRQNEKPITDAMLRQEYTPRPVNGYDVDGAVWLTKLEKDYPMIFGLLERADKRSSYEAAAKTLEGIDDEMALELLGKVSMEPLEEELVRYVRATRPA